ncbi:hypothetical protein UA75_05710 [Actinoalloteichus sp. GBA129-24]|uniref:Uncharacterized protein n=1 Tax=Actinoalloteichus fjordicus TaxID=1612552 RepID=A0AAC9LAR6_9PSEU|nr:hypothetical protein UA74_05705 [Actinoalloteichus fjordicus]APU19168.1 hypothetical protein UA75_05710 [Actinoalloteichus sp. GBA129-24]
MTLENYEPANALVEGIAAPARPGSAPPDAFEVNPVRCIPSTEPR